MTKITLMAADRPNADMQGSMFSMSGMSLN